MTVFMHQRGAKHFSRTHIGRSYPTTGKKMLLGCLLLVGIGAISGAKAQQDQDATPPPITTVTDKRQQSERAAIQDPYAISQHKENFVLAYSYMNNTRNLIEGEDGEGLINNEEAVFQISVKVPLYLPHDDETGWYFGFTSRSWWQIYNSDLSEPFRETNYQPEVFYDWHKDFEIFGLRFNRLRLGINHQSNGESQLTSRSWNRIKGSIMFSDANSLYYLDAWWRIPETQKRNPLDPTGDDNPDITDFLGYFELGYEYKFNKWHTAFKLHNNLQSDNKGSFEVNLTYQLTQRYQLLVHYFNGYGESLIDYNHSQQRFGIGLQLTYW